MNFLKKIFSFTKSNDLGEKPVEDQSSSYMPEANLPIDERFMINFKQNGGKFLYCDSEKELEEAFDNILLENDWYEKQVSCFDTNLQKRFDSFNLKFSLQSGAFFFSTCEYLIADNGAILISSHQIKEKKLYELPDHFIILASTSQITKDISAGLKGIKEQNKTKLPTNITTIKNFETTKEQDFLSYGSSAKNLYLLLLEDL